jgi:hypothetical protein
MSKIELLKTVRKEIRALNRAIDIKIIQGLSYRDEARRHKFLLMQENHLARRTHMNWFGKMASMVSTFML